MVRTPIKKIKKNETPKTIDSTVNEEIFNFNNTKPTIKSISTLIKILHESQKCLTTENIELRIRVDKLEAENASFTKKKELNDNTIKNLTNEVSELNFELNELKQEKLDCHFNINGLPELTKDESVDVVLKIANELNIDIAPTDIKDVTYFNNKKNNSHNYIFELKNIELKKEFIKKRKSLSIYVNNNLDIFSVNSNSNSINKNNSRIYINEHLSKFNHHLLNHAKSLKNCEYKYIWYKFGKILVKQTDSSETILIKNYHTVDNLIQKFHNKV